MRLNIVLATLVIFSLSGCAVNSGIVAKGSDTFFVSRQAASGFTGLSGLMPEAIQEANRYCAGLGRQFVEISSSSTQPPYVLGNFPRVEIGFKCLVGGLEDHEVCFANLETDPELAVIKRKVALSNIRDQTFSMISDNTKPSDSEKIALRIWGDKRDYCMKRHVMYERSRGTQLEITNVFESTYSTGQFQISELLNGQLTYSEFAIKRRDLSTKSNDALSKISSDINKENAESKFKASQLTIEEKKIRLLQDKISNDRDMQEKQILNTNNMNHLPSSNRTTDCNVMGNHINCSSY